MNDDQERLNILKMIQRGQITAESGFKLLEQLDNPGEKVSIPMIPEEPRSGAHWFHLVVSEIATGKVRIDLKLPVNVVTAGMKMGAKFSPQVEKLNPDIMQDLLLSGETGKIIDVYDEDDGEHIEIFLE